MHLITETLLVGNINDAREPPVNVGALLLVAAEYTLEPPSRLLYGRIPFSEYDEAEPLLLDRAVSWVEQHLSDHRVMVCCRAVMAYLCSVRGMTYAEVLKLVMTRRPGAMPLPNLQEAITQVLLLREARAKDKQIPASRRASGA
jgi:protein-tyrosine phosphatase